MQHTVCLSGFPELEKGIISGELAQLGVQEIKGLSKDVTVLVSANVKTEKYKVSSQLGIKIVNQQWVHDSFTSDPRRLLEFGEEYRLRYLTGVHIGILGFPERMTTCIKNLIQTEGGTYFEGREEIEKQIRKERRRARGAMVPDLLEESNAAPIEEETPKIDLILVRKEIFTTCAQDTKQFLIKTKKTICGLNWLANCSDFKTYIPPMQYDLTSRKDEYFLRKQNRLLKTLKAKDGLFQKKVNRQLNSVACNDLAWFYLQSCYIYIDKHYDESVRQTLMKCVDMGGGYVLDDIYPVTTHVVVQHSEDQIPKLREKAAQFRKVYIVTAQWLFDSVEYQRKPLEANYLSQVVRSVKLGLENPSHIGVSPHSRSSLFGLGLNRRNSNPIIGSRGSSRQGFPMSHANTMGDALMLKNFQKKPKSEVVRRSQAKQRSRGMKQRQLFLGGNVRGRRGKMPFKDSTNQKNGKNTNSPLSPISEIFKGYYFEFHINKNSRTLARKYKKYWELVQLHSGEVETSKKRGDKKKKSEELLARIKNMVKTVQVCHDNKTNFQKGRKFITNPTKKRQNMVVSHRWIDYCVEQWEKAVSKGQGDRYEPFAEFENPVFTTLLPFAHKVPFSRFEYKFCLSGFEDKNLKEQQQLLGRYLGGEYTIDLDEMQVLIVTGGNGKKYQDVLRHNREHPDHQIWIVRPEWLTFSLQNGKGEDILKYLWTKEQRDLYLKVLAVEKAAEKVQKAQKKEKKARSRSRRKTNAKRK